MSNQQTPEEVLDSIVEGINSGNIESLMMLYEQEACFAVQPGQIAKGQQGIRQSLQGFINMKGKLELKVESFRQVISL
jgi:ketosteroid isomerase-like protein